MPDDAELLQRYVATRANDAFAELVRRHVDGVYSAALRRVGRDVHLAEDVVQQVFVVLARKGHVAARLPALGPWLYTITRYEAAHVVRREQRRKAREHQAQLMNESRRDGIPASIDWNRIAPLLDELVDRLPAADRTAVVLRFVEQRGFTEIGAVLRVSEDAARMRLERALEKLRRALAQRGAKSSAAALGLALANQMVTAAPPSLSGTILAATTASAAAGTGSVAAGIFHFMSITKITTGIAIVAIGFALFERHAVRQAETDRTTADQRLVTLQAQLEATTARAAAAERRNIASAQPTPAAVPASASSEAPATDKIAAALAAKKSAAEMQFLTDPQLQEISAQQFKASLGLRYGALYAGLGLTGQQVEEFERLKSTRHQAEFTLGRDRILQGIAKDDPAFVARREAAVSPIDRELQALLGAAGFEQMQQFEKSSQVRTLVEAVAGTVYYSATPLTSQQGEQLANALAAANTRQRGGRAEWTDLNWDALATQAQGVLTPSQFAAMKALHDDAQLQQAVKRRMEKPSGG